LTGAVIKQIARLAILVQSSDNATMSHSSSSIVMLKNAMGLEAKTVLSFRLNVLVSAEGRYFGQRGMRSASAGHRAFSDIGPALQPAR
jgi:hypothetical protein